MAKGVVCVTGAGGFIGSWIVKLLLSRGYAVHGTVREPGDERNAHLRGLETASENLVLYKADVLSQESLAAAIVGCEGVFHAASPVPSTKSTDPEAEILAPAVSGTLNVLKAAKEAGVQRVVLFSSLAAVAVNPSLGKGQIVDEDCWSDADFCRKSENWYFLSKTLAEKEAWDYAQRSGLDLLSLCPSTVFGPMLQPSVNASSNILLSILNGGRKSIDNTTWFFVDVRDVADAAILIYEDARSSGRYICSADGTKIDVVIDLLRTMYPQYSYPDLNDEAEDKAYILRTDKLRSLGWKPRPLEESLRDSIEHYQAAGLLPK